MHASRTTPPPADPAGPPAFTYRAAPDARRTLLRVSPSVELLTGHGAEVFTSRRLGLIDTVHPDDRHALRMALARAAEGLPMAAEYRIVSPDGVARGVLDVAERRGRGGRRRLEGLVTLTGHAEAGAGGAPPARRVERAGLVPPAAVRDRLAGELARGRGRTSLVVVQVDGPDASHEAVALAAGRRLRGCVRALDPVGDAGGGRYWVLLTATPLATAMAVGRRACEAIGGHPLDGGRAVTASAGVAQATAGVPPAALIAAAEAAMLGAARAGGGRAVGAPPLVAAAGPAAA